MFRTYILYRLLTQRFEFWHPFVAQASASGPFCDRSASELQEMTQFRPNGHKTDMFRASELQLDGKIGIFGRFAVHNTMPDMFVWLEQRSDAITSNFAVREY